MSHCGGRLAETSTTEGEKREKPSVWMKEGESLEQKEKEMLVSSRLKQEGYMARCSGPQQSFTLVSGQL